MLTGINISVNNRLMDVLKEVSRTQTLLLSNSLVDLPASKYTGVCKAICLTAKAICAKDCVGKSLVE